MRLLISLKFLYWKCFRWGISTSFTVHYNHPLFGQGGQQCSSLMKTLTNLNPKSINCWLVCFQQLLEVCWSQQLTCGLPPLLWGGICKCRAINGRYGPCKKKMLLRGWEIIWGCCGSAPPGLGSHQWCLIYTISQDTDFIGPKSWVDVSWIIRQRALRIVTVDVVDPVWQNFMDREVEKFHCIRRYQW